MTLLVAPLGARSAWVFILLLVATQFPEGSINAQGTPTPQPRTLNLPLPFPPFPRYAAVKPKFAIAHYCAANGLTEKDCMDVEKYIHEKERDGEGESEDQEVDKELEFTNILSPANGSTYETDTAIRLKLGGYWGNSSIVYQFDNNKPASFSSSLVLNMDSLHPGSHTISVIIISDADGSPFTNLATSYFTIGELVTILPSLSLSTNSWYSLYPRHLWVRNIVYSGVNVIHLEAAASRVAAERMGMAAPEEGVDTRLSRIQVRGAAREEANAASLGKGGIIA